MSKESKNLQIYYAEFIFLFLLGIGLHKSIVSFYHHYRAPKMISTVQQNQVILKEMLNDSLKPCGTDREQSRGGGGAASQRPLPAPVRLVETVTSAEHSQDPLRGTIGHYNQEVRSDISCILFCIL